MIAAAARPTGLLPESIRLALAQRIAGGRIELPVLGDVATRVVQLCNQEQPDVRQLAQTVRRDQAMAGHLMRIANSALYAPPTPLVSLDQVVGRLGMLKVREIALIISCQSSVFKAPGYEARIAALFRHSLAAAAFAQEIARSRRWNVEEAFLAGLLHDVGRPVLIQELVNLHAAEKLPVDEAAIDGACEALHARVGSDLVKSWSLPVRLADAILTHHDPERSVSARNLALTTALADDLAHHLVGPKILDEAAVRTHPTCVGLNLYPEEMDALLAKRDGVRAMLDAMS